MSICQVNPKEFASLIHTYSAALESEHALRNQRRKWIEQELQAMQKAVNSEREKRGFNPVSFNVICKTEIPARAHADYAHKFALYCAELTICPFAPEDYVMATAGTSTGRILRVIDVFLHQNMASVETSEAAMLQQTATNYRRFWGNFETKISLGHIRLLSKQELTANAEEIQKFPPMRTFGLN